MKIVYRPHLIRRLKERKIPNDYPKKVYRQYEQKFFDTATSHNIAISKLEYAEKLRNMAISYDIIGENIEILTIFPISDREIENKIKSERWTENEKTKG